MTTTMTHPRSKVGLWIALTALLVGAVVAVLGGRAAYQSYQREQAIEEYSDAHSLAVYFSGNGDTIAGAMARRQQLDDSDIGLMNEMLAASQAGNVDRFNDLADQSNATNVEQEALGDQIEDFKDGFDRAFDER